MPGLSNNGNNDTQHTLYCCRRTRSDVWGHLCLLHEQLQDAETIRRATAVSSMERLITCQDLILISVLGGMLLPSSQNSFRFWSYRSFSYIRHDEDLR